jgi:hypothetical protein
MLGPGNSRGEVSIYTSTSAPPASSLLFAFGSSDGILTMDKLNYDLNWASPKPEFNSHPHPKDTFALEFLSRNPSVLLSGGRTGILNITDLRVPNFGPTPPADTIIHPSAITHIKEINSHRVIVAGLGSSLCQYDLRFRKIDTPQYSVLPSKKQRKQSRGRRNLEATRPILTYPEYHHTSKLSIGFDVDVESGMVAAAMEQDDETEHSLVRLFSLNSGEMLYTPNLRYISEHKAGFDVRCLQFVRDIEGKMKSLHVGVGQDIIRYAWTDPEEEDEWGIEPSLTRY